MKSKHLLTLLLLAATLYSCREQTEAANNNIKELNLQLDHEVDPSALLKTEYIKLETTDSSFIDKSIIQLDYKQEKIFILSGGNNRNLLVFDRSGKYLQRIGQQGNGPGEFIVPMSFTINEQLNAVSIVDLGQQKIIEYNLSDFTYKSEKRLEFYSFCFEYVNNSTLLFNNSDTHSPDKKWAFISTDSDIQSKNRFVEKKLNTGYSTGRTKNIYTSQGNVYGYSQYDPHIYKYENNKMEKEYIINFDKLRLPPQEYLNKISANNINFLSTLEVSDYIYYYCVFDTENLINVYYTAGQEPYIGLYNKSESLTYSFSNSYFEDKMRIGHMERPVGTVDGFVAAPLQPFDLKQKLKEGYRFDSNLSELVNSSLEDDNPILFLYKLNDDKR